MPLTRSKTRANSSTARQSQQALSQVKNAFSQKPKIVLSFVSEIGFVANLSRGLVLAATL
ncbi:hypothetical protein FNYG_14805 [Fusarium nygamai]|uniref:Uncharacterized protein n=1 Tax=Gibberella nygamai TaxID=42673 RepID=A0A2K0UQ35_GIBNY|nr:hypothetical protein FNYG_14805 [Fusarium nygamai]